MQPPAYNIFVPTGRYTDGASDNTGFGMWEHELAVGTTVYLDEKKAHHAAALVSFDFQSKKEDSETKVGNEMNIEGGIGGDFLKGGLSAASSTIGQASSPRTTSRASPTFSSGARTRSSRLVRKSHSRSPGTTRCMAS